MTPARRYKVMFGLFAVAVVTAILWVITLDARASAVFAVITVLAALGDQVFSKRRR